MATGRICGASTSESNVYATSVIDSYQYLEVPAPRSHFRLASHSYSGTSELSFNMPRAEKTLHEILHFAGIKDRYSENTRDPENGRARARTEKGYDETNIMASNGGTRLKKEQIKEARDNGTTKKCSIENGVTKCR